jgi:transcriptional regulator with XRE-family HTH domain
MGGAVQPGGGVMPIGEFLAAARHRAGLSVAQVSEQTRIRETIISGIESGDYSACGGDFYARGHIRAIAKAVGADAEPLIQEYDSRHRTPGAVSAVSLEELLSTSAQVPLRRRVHWKPVLALALVAVVVAGFGLYRVLSGVPRQAAAPPPAAQAGQVQQHAKPDWGFPAGHAAPRTARSRPGAHSRATLRQSVLAAAIPVSSPNDLRSPRGRHAHRPGTQRPLRPTRPRHRHPHGRGHHGHGHGHRGHGHRHAQHRHAQHRHAHHRHGHHRHGHHRQA